jgi:hypothetical protein
VHDYLFAVTSAFLGRGLGQAQILGHARSAGPRKSDM